jgi:hypothetical protein
MHYCPWYARSVPLQNAANRTPNLPVLPGQRQKSGGQTSGESALSEPVVLASSDVRVTARCRRHAGRPRADQASIKSSTLHSMKRRTRPYLLMIHALRPLRRQPGNPQSAVTRDTLGIRCLSAASCCSCARRSAGVFRGATSEDRRATRRWTCMECPEEFRDWMDAGDGIIAGRRTDQTVST